ncbi:acid protease [Ophiobolus disseminans]|uniref:Acid protease n=1 Tax=Ophiobolus disseminans TaxID=1469910 RepID=A0A6A6ZYR4_9PLEO|nr:acid protease [Ophiobolus disseminans]
MFLSFFLLVFSAHSILALTRRAPAGILVTNNILELTTAPSAHHLIPPSSRYLVARRRNVLAKRQDVSFADIQEDLLTIGGRVYMVNATIANKTYTLVIDTGSSDTWAASSSFSCEDPDTNFFVPTDLCGSGPLYNTSASFERITLPFADFGFDAGGGNVKVKQMIGVVDEGFWMGDNISSGIMGLGFQALTRGINSRSTQFSISPIFSIALSRPSNENPQAGGLLAIGGIPDILHDGHWVQTPLQPYFQDLYAFYQIGIDGFDIIPPSAPTPSPPRPPFSLH